MGEAAVVAVIVAGMGDRGHHEARFGQRQRGIVMAFERTAAAVRHDDERRALGIGHRHAFETGRERRGRGQHQGGQCGGCDVHGILHPKYPVKLSPLTLRRNVSCVNINSKEP